MENASKALTIAGGILIGLITISVFVYMFGRLQHTMQVTTRNRRTKRSFRF